MCCGTSGLLSSISQFSSGALDLRICEKFPFPVGASEESLLSLGPALAYSLHLRRSWILPCFPSEEVTLSTNLNTKAE